MDNPATFSSTQKWLHWLVAVLAILMLVAGFGLEDLPVTEREQAIMGHAGLGLIVLLLMIVRWGWRLTHAQPELPEPTPPLQQKAARIVQGLIYVLLLAQPILGILQAMYNDYQVMAFGLLDISGLAANDKEMLGLFHRLHGINAVLLIILSLGHIGAAIYHHVVSKDNVLRTMIPFGKIK